VTFCATRRNRISRFFGGLGIMERYLGATLAPFVMAHKGPNKIDYRKSPVAWFCVLERAREEGNFELAAEAMRELRRMGVHIQYKTTDGSRRHERR
jgi:hypothetical protein